MPTTKYTRVDVTQTDIDRAQRNNSSRCVVATAIARTIDGARNVSIDLQSIRFTVDQERFIYLTPPAAVGYVVAFDAGDPVHPFAFRLSENHRVVARKDRKTEAGKERLRASAAVERAERKADKARRAVEQESDPVRTIVARQDADRADIAVEQARKEQTQTVRRLAGQPEIEPDMTPDPDTGGRKRKAPPMAYRRGVRSYGSRQLRINQAPDTADERAAHRAVTAAYDEYPDVNDEE